jgi:predicted nucleotidyltransferase
VAAYLDDIVREHTALAIPLVSLILFGSAATGGYAAAGSDVDSLVVVSDDTDAPARLRVRNRVADLEARYALVRVSSIGRRSRALCGLA